MAEFSYIFPIDFANRFLQTPYITPQPKCHVTKDPEQIDKKSSVLGLEIRVKIRVKIYWGIVAGDIHICRSGPTAERPLRKRNRIKWCFNCQKHLPHMLTLTYEIEPSYYDPHVWWKCSGCKKDFTQFWGRGE